MEDKICNVIVSIERAKLAAKDLHYRASGVAFYALHLLADKVDFGSSIDELKEAHYLGGSMLPPKEMDIVQQVASTPLASDNELVSLYEALKDVVYSVEEAKREAGIAAGVHAILDGISQTALVASGLVNKSLVGNV